MSQYKVKLANGKKVQLDREGYIRVEVNIHLGDIIDRDLEEFLDHISDLATGSEALMDINYGIVRAHESAITLYVQGDPENCIHDDQAREVKTPEGYLYWDYPGAVISSMDANKDQIDAYQLGDKGYDALAHILMS